MADPNEANAWKAAFGTLHGAATAGFINSLYDRIKDGKKVLFWEKGGVEGAVQAAADRNPGITRDQIAQIVLDWRSRQSGPPPSPAPAIPPPPVAPAPAPIPPPPAPSVTVVQQAAPPAPPQPAFRVTQDYRTWNVYDPNNQPMGRFPTRAAADQWVASQSTSAPAPPLPPPAAPAPPPPPTPPPPAPPSGTGGAGVTPPPPAPGTPTPAPQPPPPPGNPFGGVLGTFVRGFEISWATHAVRTMHEFVEETAAATRRLAMFDARLATANAELFLGDFQRNITLARNTAPTGAELLRAVNRMRDEFIPWQTALTNIRQQAATGVADTFAGAAGATAILAEILDSLRKYLFEKVGPDGGTLVQNVIQQFLQAFGLAGMGPALQKGADIVDLVRKWLQDHGWINNLGVGGGVRGAWDNFVRDVAAGRGPGPATPIHGGFLLAPWQNRGEVGVFPGQRDWFHLPNVGN